ncbi:MAG: hypothetical protein ABSG21_18410 [Spirochaetia bacterium]
MSADHAPERALACHLDHVSDVGSRVSVSLAGLEKVRAALEGFPQFIEQSPSEPHLASLAALSCYLDCDPAVDVAIGEPHAERLTDPAARGIEEVDEALAAMGERRDSSNILLCMARPSAGSGFHGVSTGDHRGLLAASLMTGIDVVIISGTRRLQGQLERRLFERRLGVEVARGSWRRTSGRRVALSSDACCCWGFAVIFCEYSRSGLERNALQGKLGF